jgi:hypothetical protein
MAKLEKKQETSEVEMPAGADSTPEMPETMVDPAASAPEQTPEVPQEHVEQLDDEEEEFRQMRSDMPGVKGASTAGMVTIAVGKKPTGTKNEFFRTLRGFDPKVPIVDLEVGMDQHFFAVARGMIRPLAGIGITVTEHRLYFTITPNGAYRVVPVRQAFGENNEQNEYDRTREIALARGFEEWVRIFQDLANKCYEVFPALPGRYAEPNWPDLTHARIFKLAFRDKGRLIDSIEHPLFLKWAGRD